MALCFKLHRFRIILRSVMLLDACEASVTQQALATRPSLSQIRQDGRPPSLPRPRRGPVRPHLFCAPNRVAQRPCGAIFRSPSPLPPPSLPCPPLSLLLLPFSCM